MAAQSKLAQAIRAIVGARDKRSEELALQAIRNSILGKRGIGYMFPDGLNAGGVSGSSGVTLLGTSLGNLSQFATNEQIEQIKKAEENKPKSIANVLNMAIGGKAMAIDGLMDCATGKEIEIVNTPQFKPPPGWADENTPPVNEQWTLGIHWEGSQFGGGATFTSTTSLGAMQLKLGSLGAPPLQRIEFISGSGGTDVYNVYGTVAGVESIYYVLLSTPFPCTPGVDVACPLINPVTWPSDNKMQLSRQANGKFILSPNEPAADIVSDYTDNQHSRLDLCFSDGSGRKATIESTFDGGWMVYETLDGEAVGKGTRYNTTNTAVEIFNAADEAYAYR
jgi:hypothetical protein